MKGFIPGIAVISVMVVSFVGLMVYDSAVNSVNDSMISMHTREIEAFNSQFTHYEGVQKGTDVKMLLERLISNCNRYKSPFEPDKIPTIVIKVNNEVEEKVIEIDEENIEDYEASLLDCKGNISNKKMYNVEMEFNDEGILNRINISEN